MQWKADYSRRVLRGGLREQGDDEGLRAPGCKSAPGTQRNPRSLAIMDQDRPGAFHVPGRTGQARSKGTMPGHREDGENPAQGNLERNWMNVAGLN